MAKQSIESMYDLMFKMRDKMGEVLQDAQELATAAKSYGGEISRVLTEQLTKYYAPSIQNLMDSETTPGSIIGLIRFMDSVPLSYTRIEPSLTDLSPFDPETVDLKEPVTLNNELDNIPTGASFNNPEGLKGLEGQIKEPVDNNPDAVFESTQKIHEAVKYNVVRTSTIGSSLGEGLANLKDAIVAEFDEKEEADAKANELNETVLPSEKELLGTEYKVVEKEVTEAVTAE